MKAVVLAMLMAISSTAFVAKPKFYIQPDGGYESYLAGAIIKEHVPATITLKKQTADYVLVSHVIAH